MIHKRSIVLNIQQNILLEGLNLFHSANLTLSSDVDQDTEMFGLHHILRDVEFGVKKKGVSPK